jgi:gluconolactonase
MAKMKRRTFLKGGAIAAVAAGAARADDFALGLLPGTHYPDPRIEVLDKRFTTIGNAGIERIMTGLRWAEGPCWSADGHYLVVSDIPNNRMLRWLEDDGHVSVFRTPSNYANGNTRDLEGRLVTCEHQTRRVTRTGHDGTVTVLADRFDGMPFNAPNDVVVARDGAVWFTDPGYGILNNYEGDQAAPELPTRVYRIDAATGAVTVAADDLKMPNGLAFTTDQTQMYVVDSGALTLRLYDVVAGAGGVPRLARGKVFANFAPGTADGVRLDTQGRVWCSMGWGAAAEDGVRCHHPDGTLLAKIHLPETAANLCFGGRRRNRLFIAASTSVYAVYVDAVGV